MMSDTEKEIFKIPTIYGPSCRFGHWAKGSTCIAVFFSQQSDEGDISICILHMNKIRFTETKGFTQGYKTNKWHMQVYDVFKHHSKSIFSFYYLFSLNIIFNFYIIFF